MNSCRKAGVWRMDLNGSVFCVLLLLLAEDPAPGDRDEENISAEALEFKIQRDDD